MNLQHGIIPQADQPPTCWQVDNIEPLPAWKYQKLLLLMHILGMSLSPPPQCCT